MPATSDRVWQAIQAVSVTRGHGPAPGALAVEPGAVPDSAIDIVDESSRNTGSGTPPSSASPRLPLGRRRRCGSADGRYLLWSDIPNNRIMKWEEETGRVSIFRKPSTSPTATRGDRQGRLVTCEHDSRRVTRTEYDGTITVVLDRFQVSR